MELNKRKSLLTPAAPTVWGMIHGDINNQQDIVYIINQTVSSAVDSELADRLKDEVIEEINPVLEEALYNSSVASNVALSTRDTVNELRTYVDEQIGNINTITDDILG